MVKIKNKSDVIGAGKRFQIVLLLLFFAGFIYDVFFTIPVLSLMSDIRLFFLLLLWIFLNKISGFNSMATLRITIGLLLVMFLLFIFFPMTQLSERVGSWFYMFLLIAIIQQFLEAKNQIYDA